MGEKERDQNGKNKNKNLGKDTVFVLGKDISYCSTLLFLLRFILWLCKSSKGNPNRIGFNKHVIVRDLVKFNPNEVRKGKLIQSKNEIYNFLRKGNAE